ncbi:3-oxoacyl-ACP synthase III family protein [Galbibacter sp.]|jgi:3-oxoacyl-[acyl-carrier-protein] synthase-3|uniref:3-oxoacyl-ACP synthase III family protein n=1 Tax=Galbibacter sp. TaxID=2918471 RepID=UPI003A9118AD
MQTRIIGTGSYIPPVITKNEDFLDHGFLNTDGSTFGSDNAEIIEKFESITGIQQRRYVREDQNSSDIAFLAAEKAIEDAKIDKETLDYIIVAHNFGDVASGTVQADTVPSMATRVKHALGIKNPKCVAYDLLFGCPGWIEGCNHATAFIKAKMAKNCLVIGTETLSRIIDKHDRDSMIYADGAGAAVLSASSEEGILSQLSATYTSEEAYYLFFGESYNKEETDNRKYIKMFGRKIYEFAVTHVPKAMKECLDNSGVAIADVKKIFLHQANEKMDDAILKRFYRQYNSSVPKYIMPMNIHTLGNSSVATIPTLFDMVRKGNMENQELHKGDVIIFASVGAGMNINALVYKY